MAKTAKSGLPHGVSAVANRPELYRLTCMINGKRYSEYYRPGTADITTVVGNVSAKKLTPSKKLKK